MEWAHHQPLFCQFNLYCYDLLSRHKKGTFAFTSGFIDRLPVPVFQRGIMLCGLRKHPSIPLRQIYVDFLAGKVISALPMGKGQVKS